MCVCVPLGTKSSSSSSQAAGGSNNGGGGGGGANPTGATKMDVNDFIRYVSSHVGLFSVVDCFLWLIVLLLCGCCVYVVVYVVDALKTNIMLVGASHGFVSRDVCLYMSSWLLVFSVRCCLLLTAACNCLLHVAC